MIVVPIYTINESQFWVGMTGYSQTWIPKLLYNVLISVH